jgi:hypothetical protein
MDISSKDPEIETIYQRIKKRIIDLQPDFQRDLVWNDKKKQGLIDTIIRQWEFPPVFLIEPKSSQSQVYEVLDGQQRLNAIRSFIDNEFPIDGEMEPKDNLIKSLGGKFFSQLPDEVKTRFLMRSLRVHYLSNYRKDEPYELFFRLNQGSNLTPAEKRNTLYGEVRGQVRDLVSLMQSLRLDIQRIGFNNNRLSYQDVLSRYLYILENPEYRKKITDSDLQIFFRRDSGASSNSIETAKSSLRILSSGLNSKIKLNKPTLLTWLCFASENNIDSSFIEKVEALRSSIRTRKTGHYILDTLSYIYYEKASTSVNDAMPVQLRLLCIYLMAIHENVLTSDSESSDKARKIFDSLKQLNAFSEEDLIELMQVTGWGVI